ncbi:MAG: serpin family protein [Oscillospiraceae bacterium]|nr:serpin family protein [Oscillospiraceae bacterium]
MKRIVAALLLGSMFFAMVGCAGDQNEVGKPSEQLSATVGEGSRGASVELLSAMQAQPVSSQPSDESFCHAVNSFSLSLLQNSYMNGESCLVSPYSVYLALSMAANGAKGETLQQMQQLLGLPVEELNPYMLALQQNRGEGLLSANSVWLHEKLPVEEAFLQSLANYYSAQVYSSPFGEETLQDMNTWISEQTKGRIQDALDRMNPNAMMYLINALSFDGTWQEIYTTDQLAQGSFHGSEGQEPAQMMTAMEKWYLEDENGRGFLKDYEGGQYSFMALLPKEGMSLSEYLSTLTAESLQQTLTQAVSTSVSVSMPKFEMNSSLELQEILSKMGMVDAFTKDANFAGIESKQELYISRVLHKTSLSVDEAGTQAGAVTIEEFTTKGFHIQQYEPVVLDRPFLMGIYDKTNQCFLFLGTVESLG